MSAEMEAAFALGAGFSVSKLYLLIGSLLAAALFIWAVWSSVGGYVVWMRSDGGQIDWLIGGVISVLIFLAVLVQFL